MTRIKTWPGFASVVRDSEHTNDSIIRWFGIDEDTLLTWYSNGAPIMAHIALRANHLGMTDPTFHGWHVKNGWLVAPNERKISLRRLERIAEVQTEQTIRLIK